MPIKNYFEDVPVKALPADARRWSIALRQARERSQKVVCRLERPRDGLVFRPARIFLFIKDGETDVSAFDAPWDSNLNDWLVKEGVPAETTEAEGDRFGLAARDRFAPIEVRFGDGFFNAVLVHHLRGVGFGEISPTREQLAAIYEPQPATGEQATICVEMVDGVIARCARDLKTLSYANHEAEAILAAALAYYLDERFNITNSKLLGFK